MPVDEHDALGKAFAVVLKKGGKWFSLASSVPARDEEFAPELRLLCSALVREIEEHRVQFVWIHSLVIPAGVDIARQILVGQEAAVDQHPAAPSAFQRSQGHS